MNRDQTYINQILDAINKIQEYTVEGRDVFYETIIIQDAVERVVPKLAGLSFCKKGQGSELATLRYHEILKNLR